MYMTLHVHLLLKCMLSEFCYAQLANFYLFAQLRTCILFPLSLNTFRLPIDSPPSPYDLFAGVQEHLYAFLESSALFFYCLSGIDFVYSSAGGHIMWQSCDMYNSMYVCVCGLNFSIWFGHTVWGPMSVHWHTLGSAHFICTWSLHASFYFHSQVG